jgi:hypothetical protein
MRGIPSLRKWSYQEGLCSTGLVNINTSHFNMLAYLRTYLLTHSMEHSPREANRFDIDTDIDIQ